MPDATISIRATIRANAKSKLKYSAIPPTTPSNFLLLDNFKCLVFAFFIKWSRRWDSNPQPAVYKTAALPIELRRHGAG